MSDVSEMMFKRRAFRALCAALVLMLGVCAVTGCARTAPEAKQSTAASGDLSSDTGALPPDGDTQTDQEASAAGDIQTDQTASAADRNKEASDRAESDASGTADSGGSVQDGQTKAPDIAADDAVAGQETVYHLELLTDKDMEGYDSSRVKTITIDPEGESLVFWTEKSLTDLKLIGVDYDGDQFIEKEIFCSFDTFTAEDALLIICELPEAMADLKLTFYDELGQPVALYITRDRQTLAPVMAPETAVLF